MSIRENSRAVHDRVICGDVVTPRGILNNGYVTIDGGTVTSVGQGSAPAGRQVDRYFSSYLFPGLVDAQVHSGSFEGFAGLRDATMAAAAGGVTTIVDMPFDDPNPVNTRQLFQAKLDTVREVAHTDVALYATLPKDDVGAVADLADAGAAGIKLSTYEYHPVRFPRFSTAEMYDIFCEAATVGLPVAFHNEDQELVDRFVRRQLAMGERGPPAHAKSRPPIAELVADAQILELASQTGVHCHVVHSSLARGCRIARRYRDEGARVTVETCVHYLVFTNDDMLRQGAFLKLNPPIRDEREQAALWDSLADGDIDFISTDHVAWPVERKNDPDIFKNGSGVPGLETLLAALYTAAQQRSALDPLAIARLTSENPARHFGLYPQKGHIWPGADADITVFERTPRRFENAGMVSKVKWSPYDGMEMKGFVSATYLRGDKIFAGGEVLSEPGSGKFRRPLRP